VVIAANMRKRFREFLVCPLTLTKFLSLHWLEPLRISGYFIKLSEHQVGLVEVLLKNPTAMKITHIFAPILGLAIREHRRHR